MSRPVLVVSPVFHEYWQALQAALESLGEDVVVHCYDRTSGAAHVRDALSHRLARTRLRRWSARAETDRAVDALRTHRPRAILVVKGDTLGDAWWEAVAESGAPVVVWLYDELKNMSYDLDRLRSLAAVASYSPRDVETLREAGIRATHLPCGFDSLTEYTPVPSAAVTFIGARYPGRERVLSDLAADGVDVIAYGRQWSRHPVDVVRTGHLSSAGVRSHRDVTRPECYGLMAGSRATLNIHGHDHGGLSMRTFEAPGVGALPLIDRPDVERYYDVGSEVLVFADREELVEHVHRAAAEPAWARRVRDAGARRTAAEHTLVSRMREVRTLWG